MIYLKWLALVPISFIMAIVGRFLAPILPFFAKNDGYLPDWLSWFQTPDNSLDGDKGHWERWPDTSAWGTYKRRVAWLLRNVCYGFDISVLGQTTLPGDAFVMLGEDKVQDQPFGHGGYWLKRVYRNGKIVCWHFYFIRQWKTWPDKCIRISMGWKLFSYYPEIEELHQLTSYISLHKSFVQRN